MLEIEVHYMCSHCGAESVGDNGNGVECRNMDVPDILVAPGTVFEHRRKWDKAFERYVVVVNPRMITGEGGLRPELQQRTHLPVYHVDIVRVETEKGKRSERVEDGAMVIDKTGKPQAMYAGEKYKRLSREQISELALPQLKKILDDIFV